MADDGTTAGWPSTDSPALRMAATATNKKMNIIFHQKVDGSRTTKCACDIPWVVAVAAALARQHLPIRISWFARPALTPKLWDGEHGTLSVTEEISSDTWHIAMNHVHSAAWYPFWAWGIPQQ